LSISGFDNTSLRNLFFVMAALVVVLPSVVTTIPTLGYCEAVADVVAFAIPFGMDRRHRYWCHRSGVVDDRNQEVGKEGYLSVESFLCHEGR